MGRYYYERIEYAWNGEKYEIVSILPVEYDGPVALCKGDQVAKQTEYMMQQNMAAQMDFNRQLMGVFREQFGKQNEIMDYLKGKMTPMIENPTGYSKEALAAMRTSTTDTLSNAYQNAQRTLQEQRFATGSRDLPSGVDQQLNAALLQSEASDKAAAQNNITLADENLKQQNYWSALNVLSGVGAQYNPQSYAGAATNAANSATSAGSAVADLSQAYKASQQSGLMGALGGLAGGVFGAAGAAGGFGKLFCWIAAKHFGGWEDARTKVVRAYLRNDFGRRWYGRPVIELYALVGERVAECKLAVKLLGPLFDKALENAWYSAMQGKLCPTV